jgi:uncharacterized membrane protein
MNIVIKISNILAIFLLAFMMIFGAYNHVADPEFYDGFIPDFFPKLTVNYISAIVELIIGVLIILPNWRRLGSLLFIGLMVAFFPIHIWDLLKDVPAIGSKQLAMIRLVVQFIFIGIAYFVFKRTKLMTKSDTNA